MDWEHCGSTATCLAGLKAQGYHIYGVEQTNASQPLQDIKMESGKVAFVFGNEIDGISAEVIEICDACIEIPQAGTKHSLNIAVACGTVLWQYAGLRLSLLSR